MGSTKVARCREVAGAQRPNCGYARQGKRIVRWPVEQKALKVLAECQGDRDSALAITEFVNAELLDTELQRRSRKAKLLGGSVFPRHLAA